MPLTLQTTTILAEFVGTKQRWSWYPAGVKICHLTGNSSRQLDQFEACATRKLALCYSVSRSERPLRPVPATAPRSLQGIDDIAARIMETLPDDMACISPRHKHWPGALFRPPGQYISSFTGPYGPPRYMSGQQISNSAR